MNGPRQRARGIYEELRERICLLEYEPGVILKERDLAVEFGVSRTPLRRVLQKLENDGLIISKQGHGTMVAEIDLQELRDIYFLRIKLAEIIGESDPLMPTEESLTELGRLSDRCMEARKNPSFQTFGEINIGLHKQYQNIIRNRPLREFSDKLFYQTSRMWFQLLPQSDWQEEIEDLYLEIQAVKRYFTLGDVESAGFVHRNHLAMVIRRLNSLI
ncbi:MAG: GntR family transcriptional regulator [Pseudomonadota bacterium]